MGKMGRLIWGEWVCVRLACGDALRECDDRIDGLICGELWSHLIK